MGTFVDSSHQNEWIFSREQLRDLRIKANRSDNEQDEEGDKMDITPKKPLSQLTPTKRKDGGDPMDTDSGLPPRLTWEEELKLLRYYEEMIPPICDHFNLSSNIQCTAIVYVKRFFLYHSVMDYDPSHILLSAIYLAMKIDEKYNIGLDRFCKDLPMKPDIAIIKESEMAILQTMRFKLLVFHPYRSLRGFVTNAQSFLRKTMADPYHKAASLVEKCYHTDMPLLYSPGQIAMAALMVVGKDIAGVDMDRYLSEGLLSASGEAPNDADKLDKAKAMLEVVANDLEAAAKQDAMSDDAVKEIHARAQAYRSEANPNSAIARRARKKQRLAEEKDRKRLEKALKKKEQEEAEQRRLLGTDQPVDSNEEFVIHRPKKG